MAIMIAFSTAIICLSLSLTIILINNKKNDTNVD